MWGQSKSRPVKAAGAEFAPRKISCQGCKTFGLEFQLSFSTQPHLQRHKITKYAHSLKLT